MHADNFLQEVSKIAEQINRDDVERLARALHTVREIKGRVYVVGLGGSYANAEHCAADLRKLCEIDAYAPNASEMSAYINDEGMDHALDGAIAHATDRDALFVISVGGGGGWVSRSIASAVKKFRAASRQVLGIVGPRGGITAELGNAVVKVPAPESRITPHTEAFHAVLWHLLVSHPMLQRKMTKW